MPSMVLYWSSVTDSMSDFVDFFAIVVSSNTRKVASNLTL